MNHPNRLALPSLLLLLSLSACNNEEKKDSPNSTQAAIKGTYQYDADFVRQHSRDAIELSNADSSERVLLSGEYQGRVMTSTARGDSGISFGWINYDLLGSGQKKKQFNAIGGEERFWMGPEGGQYSIYFKAKDSFTIGNWQVPPLVDTISYDIVSASAGKAVFSKKASIVNYSGTVFDLDIERSISLLTRSDLQHELKASIPDGIHAVGYSTENVLMNAGNTDWKKENGLLSIWLLGMFTPTPKTVVIIPFRPIPNARSYITDNYFGPVPAERLQVADSVLYFTCDGKYRSKIGLSPRVAKPIAAGFDFANNVLTIVIPQIVEDGIYVNSKWELQKEPYKGDMINSYNDGPLADGGQLGPFFEIESSSPAKELKKGEKLQYRQVTCHLQGDYESLRSIAQQLLGVDLDKIKR